MFKKAVIYYSLTLTTYECLGAVRIANSDKPTIELIIGTVPKRGNKTYSKKLYFIK